MSKKTMVLSAVIGGIIGGAFSELYTTFKPLSMLIAFLQEPVTLKIWGLLSLIFGLPSFSFALIYLLTQTNPDYYRYTTENFYDIKWFWTWKQNSVCNLVALCPNCEFQMTETITYDQSGRNRNGYYCDKCGHKPNMNNKPSNDEMENIIERMIHQRVRTKEYKRITEQNRT